MAATRQGRGKGLEEYDIFARLSLGGEAVRAADQTVMVRCPLHLHEQSPFFAHAKKRKKPLNIVTLPLQVEEHARTAIIIH